MPMHRIFLITVAFCLHAVCARAGVRVYECRDARGRVTLRDTPCTLKETQAGTREMLRPKDPAPTPVIGATTMYAPQTPERVRIVREVAPAPLYSCITAEGEQYVSESPQGEGRYQPAFYPVMTGPVLLQGGGARLDYQDRHTSVSIGGGSRLMAGGMLPGPQAYSVWVQDRCSPMPAEASCAALEARRDAIRRRNVAQQQSERERLYHEEATVEARMRSVCTQ